MRLNFEAICLGVVGFAWYLALQAYHDLPAVIPTHFGASGAANAHGSKDSLLMLPVTITGMYLFLTATQFIPVRSMNLPVKVTDENRDRVSAVVSEMLSALKLCTVLTLTAVEWGSIDAAARGTLPPWFLLAIVVPSIAILGVMFYYLARLR